MVDPTQTFITGEGVDVCILVIPHRWLGGLSLVVWSFPAGINLLWAAVTDLRDHDQIDFGYMVARWPQARTKDLGELEATLADELSRPIEWRQTYRGVSPRPRRVTAGLDQDGKRASLELLRSVSLWPLPGRDVVEQTALDAAQPPSFRLPVPIDKLLRQA